MFEIRELRQLISLDDFRHFGRAAKAVGLSQPTLTKSLQRIEQSLGARLFERSRSGVVPTVIGKEVLGRARRLVEEADELKRTVDLMSGAEAGSVRIGVGPAMSETYVAAALASLASQKPQTQVVVRVDHWQQLTDWLLAGELDFYIADIGSAQIDGRFIYTSLPAQRMVWFCRSGHALAKRKKKVVTRTEMLRFPLASPTMPAWASEWFAAALGDDGLAGLPRPFPAVVCESYSMLKQIVLSSDCISAALQQSLAGELEEGSIAILPVDAPVLTTHAGIVRLADRTLSPLAAEVAATVESRARRSQ